MYYIWVAAWFVREYSKSVCQKLQKKQWNPLFSGRYRTSYPPGRLDWHFHWVWSRQGCPLESGWWTWSQTGWHHRLIAAKRSRPVNHLAGTGYRGRCCIKNTNSPGKVWMEALLCEQGGHPNLYGGKMGGPGQDNDNRKVLILHNNHQVFQEGVSFSGVMF